MDLTTIVLLIIGIPIALYIAWGGILMIRAIVSTIADIPSMIKNRRDKKRFDEAYKEN